MSSKIVSWFSCGNNSAVASKLILTKYPNDEIIIARCVINNEHIDNDRFHKDCEKCFNHEIIKLSSDTYKDCWDVWTKRKYISGIKGAPCTIEMKKAVRWAFEKSWCPDTQVFGFSLDEQKRANRFRQQNPDINLLAPLIDNKITKPQCAEIIIGAGIELPVMYKLGFKNNNCIACAKATSIVYWARIRHYFPEQFERMANLSRKLGAKLAILKGIRIFLDEIPKDIDWNKKSKQHEDGCGLLCNQ